MSQSSFVLNRDLQFTDAGFLAKAGDVFVYTPPQTLVVYRNGDLQIRMATSQAALDGLMIAKSISRIQEAPAISEPVAVPPAPPLVPEPEDVQVPVPEPEEAPVEPVTPSEEVAITAPEAHEPDAPEAAVVPSPKPAAPKATKQSKKK